MNPARTLLKTACLLAAGLSSTVAAAGILPCIIVDKTTGSSIPAATVCMDGGKQCRKTDTVGKVVINGCIPGSCLIRITADSYEPSVLPGVYVRDGLNPLLRIELTRTQSLPSLDTITVTASRNRSKKPEQVASVRRLGSFELETTAGTANDINRILLIHPSVITAGGNEFDNTILVRGGHAFENVFVIDGIELDNISHYSDVNSSGGMLGFVDGSLLETLDFYIGSMPASLPPRMSSVVDMVMRNGSQTKHRRKLQLSITGLGLTAEGPFLKNKSTYLLSLRYSDLRFLLPLLDNNGDSRFGDGHAKITVPINRHHRISLTAVGSLDNYSLRYDHGFLTDKYRLLQYASGLQWNCTSDRFTNRLLASVVNREEELKTLQNNDTEPDSVHDEWYKNGEQVFDDTAVESTDTVLHYIHRIDQTIPDRLQYRRQILQLKDDFTWLPYNDDRLGLGIVLSRYRYYYRETQQFWEYLTRYWLSDPEDPESIDSSIYSNPSGETRFNFFDTSVGAYCNYVFYRAPLKIVTGLRGDYYRMLHDVGISPRCAVSLDIPKIGTAAFSAGLNYQQPSELIRLLRFMVDYTTLRQPLASTIAGIELQRSWQGVLSFTTESLVSHEITLASYYKWYDREYARTDPESYLFFQEYWQFIEKSWESNDTETNWLPAPPRGRKKTYGIEFFLQKKRQTGLYYAIGYALMTIQNRYACGKWYNDRNNVRNNGTVILGFNWKDRHIISARVHFNEGRPYCKTLTSFYGGKYYDTTAGFFTERLDPICSVNMRYNFIFKPRFVTFSGYIEAWNILNTQPVIRRELIGGAYHDLRAIGIIPSIGLNAEF